MRDVLEAAREVQAFIEGNHWRFAFIGGIANMAWGSIRTTQDADLTLYTAFQDEADFVEKVLSKFQGRMPDAFQFALRARVLLVNSSNGTGIDIGLGGFPYEEQMINRSKIVDFDDDIQLRVASSEDLVIMKAFAGRGQDWVDVDGVARRQGAKLDWEYVFEQAPALSDAKDDDLMLGRLIEIQKRWA